MADAEESTSDPDIIKGSADSMLNGFIPGE
jgi:hypothetical protein